MTLGEIIFLVLVIIEGICGVSGVIFEIFGFKDNKTALIITGVLLVMICIILTPIGMIVGKVVT